MNTEIKGHLLLLRISCYLYDGSRPELWIIDARVRRSCLCELGEML